MAVIDVSRPIVRSGWKDLLLAPLELLALAWSVPFLVLAVLAPIGLVIAGALKLARAILGT
jgi:hypothetical protein